MVLRQSAAPSVEPLSLAEAKAHLRVDATTEDALISDLIQAAREHCELLTRRQFITATWELKLDEWSDDVVLPRPPLQTVSGVVYVDTLGVAKTLAITYYDVDAASEPGRLIKAYGMSYPSARSHPNAITITYKAGYGDAAISVPEGLRAAMKLLIGHLYENREAVIVGRTVGGELPYAVEALLWPYRIFREV